MNYVRTTYVEFLYPGPLFSESSTDEVTSRDLSGLKVPKNAFGFRFFDILSVVVDIDGKPVELSGERVNLSPLHYYGGKLYTLTELKRDFPNNSTLIRNIEHSGCDKAIRCRTGNWQPFEKTDVFIEETA